MIIKDKALAKRVMVGRDKTTFVIDQKEKGVWTTEEAESGWIKRHVNGLSSWRVQQPEMCEWMSCLRIEQEKEYVCVHEMRDGDTLVNFHTYVCWCDVYVATKFCFWWWKVFFPYLVDCFYVEP